MGSLTRFEEREAWQKARLLARSVYEVSSTHNFARDFGLCDHIRRAAVSVMSNIAEGFERGGTKEFCHFLSIAKGSTGEVKTQLYVALDAQYITPEQFDSPYRLAQETGRLIGGFMRYLQASPIKGTKYTPLTRQPETRNSQLRSDHGTD